MKTRFLLAVAALTAACTAPDANPAPDGAPGVDALSATLETVGTPTVGGPVEVEFALTNTGNETLHVLTWYTPLEGMRSDLFVVESDAGEHRYRGMLAKRASPPAEAYVTLAPGATERRVVDLAPAYGIDEPGTYRVRFERPLLDVVPEGEPVPGEGSYADRVALGDVETAVVVGR